MNLDEVIYSQPVLTMLLDRLRANPYVDPGAFTDADVLSMLNDGYRDVCASTRCLKVLTTIATIADQSEYPLPDDFDEMVAVVTAGRGIPPIAIDDALTDPQELVGYYVYGTIFGVVPTPIADSADILILYSAQPPLLDYNDPLDPRYPPEFSDLLYHWVRWRAQIMAGGAERIGSATTDRQMYDLRLQEMRRSVNSVPKTSNAQLHHVQGGARRLV